MQKFSIYGTQERPHHDYKCIFGDLNYRIDGDNQDIRNMVAVKDYAPLLRND